MLLIEIAKNCHESTQGISFVSFYQTPFCDKASTLDLAQLLIRLQELHDKNIKILVERAC